MTAIKLNHQPVLLAAEINDKRPDGLLSSELDTVYLMGSEMCP